MPFQPINYLRPDEQLRNMYVILDQTTAAQKVLKIIEDPKRWIQHGKATNKSGEQVDPRSPMARKWSFVGAVHKADLTKEEVVALKLLVETPSINAIEFSESVPHDALVKQLTIAASDLEHKRELVESYCTKMLKSVASYLEQQRASYVAHSDTHTQPVHEG